ncbi:hypothetical protein, partial [Erwinia sp. V71]|uniref:hypothetical protein n=1 Tax=Erwinia sp. V71 TaxID=3369424 RepID=UPI003F5E4503
SLFIYHTMTGRKNGSHRINRTFLNHCKLKDNFSLRHPLDSLTTVNACMKGKKKYIVVHNENNILGVIGGFNSEVQR